LQTLEFLKKKKSHIILLAHLGKPEGKVVPELSFKNILHEIEKLLLTNNIPLQELNQYQETRNITLLENLRFDPGEEANSPQFAQKLASLGDIYVNDAFSVSHRAHASTVGIPQYLPCFSGLALNSEFSHLSMIFKKPKHPITLIVGGKKVSDKIGVLKHLATKVDHILIGGACANSFYQAQGKDIKNSYSESNMLDMCKRLLASYSDKITLPVDFVENDNQNLDIGKQTIQLFSKIISKSKTVIWAGPLGKYEEARFNQGNISILHAVTKTGITSVIGGGDTIAALQPESEFQKVSFVSLGGGAMLEFLEKETLPGLEPLFKM
ncbi:MAG: phosphoglycerate kinase, partial [Candidatus Abawacabacteria bacterium RBG_16_42_10]